MKNFFLNDTAKLFWAGYALLAFPIVFSLMAGTSDWSYAFELALKAIAVYTPLFLVWRILSSHPRKRR